MEELTYTKAGQLATDSAYKYKIPTVATVPREFNVSLMNNSGFKDNVYSSKVLGGKNFDSSVFEIIIFYRVSVSRRSSWEPVFITPCWMQSIMPVLRYINQKTKV
jgi:xanthine dehydrogenase molybdopterin-binding subunit B